MKHYYKLHYLYFTPLPHSVQTDKRVIFFLLFCFTMLKLSMYYVLWWVFPRTSNAFLGTFTLYSFTSGYDLSHLFMLL